MSRNHDLEFEFEIWIEVCCFTVELIFPANLQETDSSSFVKYVLNHSKPWTLQIVLDFVVELVVLTVSGMVGK